MLGTCRLLFADGAVARLGASRWSPAHSAGAGWAPPILDEAEAARPGGRRERGSCSPRADRRPRPLPCTGGYTERGDVFVEAGIEHVAMEKRLA